MVVLLPCSCLNVTVHLTGSPRHVDVFNANSDPAWQALVAETGWPTASRGQLSIGGVAVQHSELLSVRTVRGWTVYTCVNCACDVYAVSGTDKSFVALNPSLRLCTGRTTAAPPKQDDATSTAGTRYSTVFHVMVDADPPPLSEGQGPPLGDAHAAEVFAALQSSVQRYYEEEQRQMTARIAAYMEQEEKQLERLRAQALRDRDAIWHRLRTHALSQLRRTSATGGSASSASLTPTDSLSPSVEQPAMQTTPVPGATSGAGSDGSLIAGHTPPSPTAASTSAGSTIVPTAVVAQTPLGPETDEVFAFDEEIPPALFQSPSLGPQDVAAVNAALAGAGMSAQEDEDEDATSRQRTSGTTTPTPLEPMALDDTQPQQPQPVILGRSRRTTGRAVDEDFAGFAMRDMPARPRMYSASLPMTVPPTPTRVRISTAQGVLRGLRVAVEQQQQAPPSQQQQPFQQPLEPPQPKLQQLAVPQTEPRVGWPSPNTESAAVDQAPPTDMSRSFAVPLSSSRRLRALYF